MIAFPNALEITAKSNDGVIMALSHRTLDVKGVQFHPESIMTTWGKGDDLELVEVVISYWWISDSWTVN